VNLGHMHTRSSLLKATATFFANNTIALHINTSQRVHEPVELGLSAIFGPFGLLSSPHLTRHLRRVDLTISFTKSEEDAVALHRVRINHFVDTIKQRATDVEKRPLLRCLHVRLISKGGHKKYLYPGLAPHIERYRFAEHMFNLERFTELTHIPTVEFAGLPEWFAKCLTLRVRGEGGDLNALKWPMETRRTKNGRFVRPWQGSTRQDWQASLDWMEFAQRNGIEMPEDASRFFPPAEDAAT
jgi:hypothetical protein